MNKETKLILETLEYLLKNTTPTYKQEMLMSDINDALNPTQETSLTEKTKDALEKKE
ncbi:hypothetical protein LCGC14_3053250 [marine sediment metagenome]|uniref:Uncharacterized protein n=1 Tax=marine sediment metagenome TaxID=412755 RepID=A0A0F8WLJ0_9ZZZZ